MAKELQLDFLLDDRIRSISRDVVRAELAALLGAGVVRENFPSLIGKSKRPRTSRRGLPPKDPDDFLALVKASGLLGEQWEGNSKDLRTLIVSAASKLTPEQIATVPPVSWIGRMLWLLNEKYGGEVLHVVRRTASKGFIWRIAMTAMTANDGKDLKKGRRV